MDTLTTFIKYNFDSLFSSVDPALKETSETHTFQNIQLTKIIEYQALFNSRQDKELIFQNERFTLIENKIEAGLKDNNTNLNKSLSVHQERNIEIWKDHDSNK
jgi:hypothetical protein